MDSPALPVRTLASAAVDELNQQAWALQAADPRRAIALAEEAGAAAADGYPEGAARSHFILGAAHARLDAYEAARAELLAAAEAYEALHEAEPQANALNMLGNVHSALGDHHAAYALYMRSLALRQELGLTGAEAASWNNIGNACYHLCDYQHALEAHQRSLAIKAATGDQAGSANSLSNIGNVYRSRGEPELALRYYRQALTLAQAVGSKYTQAGALGNLGTIYSDLKNPRAALECHLQSLALEREIGNRHGQAESLLQLGRLFFASPELALGAEPDADPSLDYLREALALAADLQAREIVMRIAELLAQLYEQRGDLAQALAYFRQFHKLERALFNETMGEKTKKLQIVHQVATAKQDAELKRVEAELARLKNSELQALLHEADHQRALAEEANQFKTKLLSVAAHDLRNPLTGIRGFSDLMLREVAEGSLSYDLALRISQIAQRMEHMLDDLLESTRIEAGGLSLTLELLDLGMLAQQVAEVYQQPAQHKGQTLLIEAGKGGYVLADEASMWRVLDNLLGNAVKFSPYHKHIWLTVARHEQQIRCTVRDEGPGLSADDQIKLFGRFERLSARPTGGEGSTGLGLAIVHQLVELQGGRVWAESPGPGQGSTFIVEFPAQGPPAPGAP